jgi:hypothetical protein
MQVLHGLDGAGGLIEMGVNKGMCGCCRRGVQSFARRSGRQVIVVDPGYVRRFHPDGSIDIYLVDDPGQVFRIAPGVDPSISINAPPTDYDAAW